MVEKAACEPHRLLGRHREMNVLAAAVRRLAVGRRGGVIVLEGERGAGKTALLDAARREAQRSGTGFLAASATSAERLTPLLPLARALGDPGIHSAADVERSLMVRAVAGKPLILAIDDLEEADDATLQAVRRLSARLSRRPILWLVTSAPGRAGMTMRALVDAGAAALQVGPLCSDDVRALAQDHLGGPPGTAVVDLISDLGGYPGPIVRLLRALREQDLVALHDGAIRLVGSALQHALDDRGQPADDRANDLRALLTRSELAVAELVALGATNRQAAQQLYLSPHTVSSHLRHAFEKLGIRSRIELAILFAGEIQAAS